MPKKKVPITVPDGHKYCFKCCTAKPRTEFNKNKYMYDGVNNRCRLCSKVWETEYRKSDESKRRKRYQHLRDMFGMSPEDYEKLIEEQNNQCKICGKNGKDCRYKVLVVDHCHATGKIRGLLCDRCNIGLGKFKDNLALLDSAAKYLRDTA